MAAEERQPLIGILVTDAVISRPPGDVGNPDTYPFPVLTREYRPPPWKGLSKRKTRNCFRPSWMRRGNW